MNRGLKKDLRRQVTHAGSNAKVAMDVALSQLGAGKRERVRDGFSSLETAKETNIEDAG